VAVAEARTIVLAAIQDGAGEDDVERLVAVEIYEDDAARRGVLAVDATTIELAVPIAEARLACLLVGVREHRIEIAVPIEIPERDRCRTVAGRAYIMAVEAAGAVAEGPRELVVSSETDAGKGVLVSVRDTGGGFDEAKASRLFDAFFTTKPGGLGMGLAISRSIVESHRGRIWAAPNSPRGAVFRFTVPVLATA